MTTFIFKYSSRLSNNCIHTDFEAGNGRFGVWYNFRKQFLSATSQTKRLLGHILKSTLRSCARPAGVRSARLCPVGKTCVYGVRFAAPDAQCPLKRTAQCAGCAFHSERLFWIYVEEISLRCYNIDKTGEMRIDLKYRQPDGYPGILQ